MTVNTVAHINLRGDARDALEFYRSVFGGDLTAVTYRDAGDVQNPDEADQLMWGQVTSAAGFQVMAYDVPSTRPWSLGEHPFFVSVRGSDAQEISTYWDKLSPGSAVVVPLAPSRWTPLYGMLTDRFGVTWVLDVQADYSAS